MMRLYGSEKNFFMIRLAVLTQYRSVANGRTNGQSKLL